MTKKDSVLDTTTIKAFGNRYSVTKGTITNNRTRQLMMRQYLLSYEIYSFIVAKGTNEDKIYTTMQLVNL